jgi:hypothetical protein
MEDPRPNSLLEEQEGQIQADQQNLKVVTAVVAAKKKNGVVLVEQDAVHHSASRDALVRRYLASAEGGRWCR